MMLKPLILTGNNRHFFEKWVIIPNFFRRLKLRCKFKKIAVRLFRLLLSLPLSVVSSDSLILRSCSGMKVPLNAQWRHRAWYPAIE
jgi:hypothetical protein